MRILLTGVTGRLGRAVAQGLLAAGHQVAGVADRRHPGLDPSVDFACASLDHPVLYEIIADVDVVIHLPANPAMASQAHVVRVCDAAARSGVRVIFPSYALLEPEGWLAAERLVETSWTPNLIVRTAIPVGRQVDAAICRSVASLLPGHPIDAVRVLHHDDLVRFLVVAVDRWHTGVVDLGTTGMCSMAYVTRVLNSVTPRLKARGVDKWAQLAAEMDLERVHDLWGFECGWGAVDAVVDTARGLRGRRLTPANAVAIPGEFPLPVDISPGLLDGEFDDRIDARFPVFVAARFNQALDAPLTPMSLDLHMSGLRSAGRQLSGLLGLTGDIADEWDNRLVGAFGQRIYFGASAVAAAEAQLSRRGIDIARRLHTAVDPDVDIMTPSSRSKGRISVATAARIHSAARALEHHVEVFHAAATDECQGSDKLCTLRDSGLNVRIRMLRNRVYEGWSLWAASLLLAERSWAPSAGLVNIDISQLVSVTRAHPYLRSMIDSGDVAGARAAAPMFATSLDRAIAAVGHRGPGEIDLAATVFADRSDIIVQAVRRAMTDSVGTSATSCDPDLQQRAHDSTMAFTHQLRLAVRELARRKVADHLLGSVGDIFYLTIEEALMLPEDAHERIERRMGERERLRGVRPPAVIEGEWVPLADPGVATVSTELRGRERCPGSITGSIRVVRSVHDLPVAIGEIAVIAAADMGYAALIGTPSGVIVDGDAGMPIDGVQSESVPSVFLTGASRQLRTGMRVQVDGSAGLVTVLSVQPAVGLVAVR